MLIFLWLFYISLPFAFGAQDYYWSKFDEQSNANEVSTRLLTLMQSYYEDASQRMTECNHMRFMYEESSHYEMGYVMHEIIERYRKMVEQMHRLVNYRSNVLYDNIERCELIQKLYFEIYHLVNMLHEIPLKWKHQKELNVQKPMNMTEYTDVMTGMTKNHDRRKKEAKKLKKILKKRREMIQKGLLIHAEKPGNAKRVPYNPHWPLDYGWEIDWW